MRALLLGVTIAAASPLVELQWDAPPSCPTRDDVLEAIDALVPASPAVEQTPRVEASVETVDDAFRLRLRLTSAHGERSRELLAARCDSLATAVAVEVAMLYEAEAEEAAREEQDADPPVREPATKREPEPTRVLAPAKSRLTTPPPLRFRIRGGALVGTGVAERTLAAPTLGVAMLGRGFAVDLDLAHWPGGFASIPARDDVGTSLSTTSIVVDGCGRWQRERFALAGCGGIEAGMLHARGVGLQQSRPALEPLVALVVIPRVEVGVWRMISISIAPWIRWTVVRPGVRVDGVGEVFRAPAFGFGGALRLEFELPGRKRTGRDISGRSTP